MTTDPQIEPEADPTLTVDVAVVGAGIPGLVAARDLARRGYTVAVIDAADAPGGNARGHLLGDARISFGPHGASDGGDLAALAAELGLATVRRAASRDGIRVPGRTLPMPENSISGIPGTPLANDVIAVVGWGGALRAYLDRLRPVLKIGKYRDLDRLVRSRMGRAVADRMLAPVLRAEFGSARVPVETALPTLNNAITRAGSLSGGATILVADRALGGDIDVVGGLESLVDALVADLTEYHGQLMLGTRLDIAGRDDEGWLLRFEHGESLRVQELLYAPDAAPERTLVAMHVPDAALSGSRGFGTVYASLQESAVVAEFVTDLGRSWEHRRADDATTLIVGFNDDIEGADADLVARAARDAGALLGTSLTPTAAVVMRPAAALAVPGEDSILTVAATDPLSERVQAARAAAASVRRDAFAVPGEPWSAAIADEDDSTMTNEGER